MTFDLDTKGKSTNLIPIVTIEPPDAQGRFERTVLSDECILLSTNSITLDHIHSVHPNNEGTEYYRNLHFKPLLLDVGSVKNSVDIRSKNYKTSNITLNISNVEYGGKRFSDILSSTSLSNWLITLQFISPNANKFSTIFPVQSWNGENYTSIAGIAPSFYDAYNENIDLHPNFTIPTYDGEAQGMSKMIYQGLIRDLSHNDVKVIINAEDATSRDINIKLPNQHFK